MIFCVSHLPFRDQPATNGNNRLAAEIIKYIHCPSYNSRLGWLGWPPYNAIYLWNDGAAFFSPRPVCLALSKHFNLFTVVNMATSSNWESWLSSISSIICPAADLCAIPKQSRVYIIITRDITPSIHCLSSYNI